MYPKERITYFLVWTLDRILNFGIFVVFMLILFAIVGGLLSLISPIIGLGSTLILLIIFTIIKEVGESLSKIIPRLRNPYEPYSTTAVILSEMPFISIIYSMRGLFLNDFSKKMDSLSY